MLKYLKSFAHLLYPRNCTLCYSPLKNGEETICARCTIALPRSNFHKLEENPLYASLMGRIELHRAFAFLLYQKQNSTQQAIHAIKYYKEKELAYTLSRLFAKEVLQDLNSDFSVVVPVPLHPARMQQRGFNQAELIAEVIADELEIPLGSDYLLRNTNSTSQTTRNRFDRWKNMNTVFEIHNIHKYSGKHVLLVDDVITTGSTIEAAAHVTNEVSEKLSIAALAFTYS
jgi:ComF family protein